jgi:hypothetical protein
MKSIYQVMFMVLAAMVMFIGCAIEQQESSEENVGTQESAVCSCVVGASITQCTDECHNAYCTDTYGNSAVIYPNYTTGLFECRKNWIGGVCGPEVQCVMGLKCVSGNCQCDCALNTPCGSKEAYWIGTANATQCVNTCTQVICSFYPVRTLKCKYVGPENYEFRCSN